MRPLHESHFTNMLRLPLKGAPKKGTSKMQEQFLSAWK